MADSSTGFANRLSIKRIFYSQGGKNYMLVGVPWSWLNSSPPGDLIIDPTTTVTNSDDVYLQDATNFGSNTSLIIGKSAGVNKTRTIIKFNIGSSVPSNATVLNAQIKLRYYGTSGSTWIDRWVQAHQVLRHWRESEADSLKRRVGSNWLSPRGKIGPGSDSTLVDANGQYESTTLFKDLEYPAWKSWDLTALTQKWVNLTASNYGVILWATNEDANGMNLFFRSSEYTTDPTMQPKLEVIWSQLPRTVYFLKDHLGSIRASVQDTVTAPVVGYDDYDPWGYVLAGRSSITSGWGTQAGIMKNKFTSKEWDDEFGLNWNYFGARYYDPLIARWMVRDLLAEKYPHLSPFVYVSNNPIAAFDPNGKETYFVNGAGNDPGKWGYSAKIVSALQNAGISDVKHVPITQGQIWDQLYSVTRNSGINSRLNFYRQNSIDVFDDVTYKSVLEPNAASLVNAVHEDIKAGNIGSEEQLNLIGYSFGSVVTANAALELASKGTTVNNLVLIGSTVSTDSDLYKALSSNTNIKNIIRIDISNDKFSNPKGIMDIIKGISDALKRGDTLPHFIYAVPENDQQRKELAEQLYNAGVR